MISARIVLASFFLTALLSCTEIPTEPVDGPSFARTPAPSLVIVIPHSGGAGVNQRAGGITVDNLIDAVALVRPGGTIRILPGRFDSDGIRITKSLTIVGSGMPTIDFGGNRAGFGISGGAEEVTIRGLRLTNADVNVIEIAIFSPTASHFLIEDNEIHGSSGNGVFASTREATIEIRGNKFVGGRQGVSVDRTSNAIIENNTFEGHSFWAFGLTHSSGRAEGNTVSGCGTMCFSVFRDSDITGRVEILNNRFEIDIEDPLDSQAFDGGAGGRGQLVLRGNDFIGSGGTRDPGDSNTWAIPGAAFLTNNWESVEVVGNRVEGAFTGITLEQLEGSFLATDNVFVGVATPVDAFGGLNFMEGVEIHSNDFTQFSHAIHGNEQSFSDGAVTCNWWGSAAGPAGAVSHGISLAVYTPWATAEVAGTTTTSCT